MRRRLLNTAAVFSLLLSIAIVALWLRSYWCSDEITYRGPTQAIKFRSYDGSFYFITSRFMVVLPGWTHIFNSRHYPAESGWMDQADLTWRAPFLSLFIWTAALPFWMFVLPYVRAREDRKKQGLCRRCGYDLRATPKRCPECGEVPAIRPPHNPPMQRTGAAV
jgi:hypothetical protein